MVAADQLRIYLIVLILASEYYTSFYCFVYMYRNLSTENLRFLTPSQAVADVAHFVQHIKRSVPGTERSAVLVFGYHYTGSLAAWSRQKYPHLVDAAWASSSPLQSVVNHTDFTVLTGWSWMETGGLSCYARISNGFRELEQMIANNEMARLREMFGMCDELPNTEMDAATFFSGLFEYYSLVAKQLKYNFRASAVWTKVFKI